jgi:hypothetical protein
MRKKAGCCRSFVFVRHINYTSAPGANLKNEVRADFEKRLRPPLLHPLARVLWRWLLFWWQQNLGESVSLQIICTGCFCKHSRCVILISSRGLGGLQRCLLIPLSGTRWNIDWLEIWPSRLTNTRTILSQAISRSLISLWLRIAGAENTPGQRRPKSLSKPGILFFALSHT